MRVASKSSWGSGGAVSPPGGGGGGGGGPEKFRYFDSPEHPISTPFFPPKV